MSDPQPLVDPPATEPGADSRAAPLLPYAARSRRSGSLPVWLATSLNALLVLLLGASWFVFVHAAFQLAVGTVGWGMLWGALAGLLGMGTAIGLMFVVPEPPRRRRRSM